MNADGPGLYQKSDCEEQEGTGGIRTSGGKGCEGRAVIGAGSDAETPQVSQVRLSSGMTMLLHEHQNRASDDGATNHAAADQELSIGGV